MQDWRAKQAEEPTKAVCDREVVPLYHTDKTLSGIHNSAKYFLLTHVVGLNAVSE